MGHQRLGDIPKTQKWKSVVEKITSIGGGASGEGSGGAHVNTIAATILEAAEGGLAEAVNDPGLQSTARQRRIRSARAATPWSSTLRGSTATSTSSSRT